ncbi:MAG: hypothetical protein QNJ61_18650, partial [Desulfobacterales bacterium]|nr:hypothetical protein [Desulfobacterales bacterium]
AALRFSPRHCGVHKYASFLRLRKPCSRTFYEAVRDVTFFDFIIIAAGGRLPPDATMHGKRKMP